MKFDNTLLLNIKADLIESIKTAEAHIAPDHIEILDWGYPHETAALPNGKMAIYIFIYKTECLKVGEVGPNSNARYNSQHYNPDNSGSNLSKSILGDSDFNVEGISPTNVGDWIKANTQRINILLDERLGMFVLNFAESYFQLKLKQKYEGFKNQNN
jgi:hypothetical protein